MKILAVIPARYASTRFPGKPLAMLGHQRVIQHVYERVSAVLEHVVVATDDARIFDHVIEFGGKAVMTSSDHPSGTDRIREAYEQLGESFDIIVNVQGDEPFIQREQLEQICACFEQSEVDIATLVMPFSADTSFETLSNPNTPKVVLDEDHFALYFSRSVIPYLRGVSPEQWATTHTYYKHIGLYAYRASVLQAITQLAPAPLEQAESLEQLRWLSAGYRIKVALTQYQTIGIDTPEDLALAQAFLSKQL